ncbi:MAG: hypothetical protein KI791_20915 [Cyclobacteriaceae bacterium]|nr:hypothetical protein [Cyclobacteriaceae bacterium SS2]
MIRISTLTFICIVAFQLNAQVLGTIKDPDGYTNVRTEPTIKSEIKGQFYSDEIFLIADFDYDTIPDWRFVGSGYTSEHQLRGWMHASRVQDLDLMPEPVRPEISEDQKTITFKNDTILFKVTFQEFDSTNHKIIYDERGYITSIDGKYPQGTDGYLPIENIKNIIFNINGKQVDFPKEAYFDLYNFRKNTWRFYRNRLTGTLMIRSDNSDGGAFYMVVWKFNNYQYKGRFLSSI